VKRGARFVEAGNLASAGGLSSGIDLALRVVERYYGRTVALGTADQLAANLLSNSLRFINGLSVPFL
jgi:transcriptional regulator GlxA family with amidase domain